jgi:hypothetical protein
VISNEALLEAAGALSSPLFAAPCFFEFGFARNGKINGYLFGHFGNFALTKLPHCETLPSQYPMHSMKWRKSTHLLDPSPRTCEAQNSHLFFDSESSRSSDQFARFVP